MFRAFSRLPELHQGLIYMAAGCVAILYALGFFTRGITWLIIIFAIYAIIKGLMKSGIYDKIVHAINRR
jgi:hypothetical protein